MSRLSPEWLWRVSAGFPLWDSIIASDLESHKSLKTQNWTTQNVIMIVPNLTNLVLCNRNWNSLTEKFEYVYYIVQNFHFQVICYMEVIKYTKRLFESSLKSVDLPTTSWLLIHLLLYRITHQWLHWSYLFLLRILCMINLYKYCQNLQTFIQICSRLPYD